MQIGFPSRSDLESYAAIEPETGIGSVRSFGATLSRAAPYDEQGALVLSALAGAAQELEDAVIINPA